MNTELFPSYFPPKEILYILEGHGTKNRVLASEESTQELLNRVTRTLFEVERSFGTPEGEIDILAKRFAEHFVNRDFTPGVPTLTNAGRPGYEEATLSSCVVIPVDLRKKSEATETILAHYRQNMGSGFNFTKYDDPVGQLKWVNQLSINETAQGHYDRRIANMGTLHVAHPKIREFLQAKVGDKSLIHFNISIDVTDQFMDAAIAHGSFALADGQVVDAYQLLQEIASATWSCGDPGLVNIDRMNQHNPLANLSAYDCLPPCGEMGLALGETCQFGYINLANYVDLNGKIQVERLNESVHLLVRVLDNAIEYGLEYQPTPEGKLQQQLKRKIGISVCGLADALIKSNLAYDSEEGRQLARDLVSLINYQAKLASVELAKLRGSCGGMNFILANKYFEGYVAERFATNPTNTVSTEQWLSLDKEIRETGMLRNIHHTALPPGGRASMILGVNHSIEPFFSPSNLNIDTIGNVMDFIARSLIVPVEVTDLQELLVKAISDGTFQNLPISVNAKRILRTAIEIGPDDHLLMVAALAGKSGISDESASKTVNLSEQETPQAIARIFIRAHQLGLFNISVYRDHCLDNQPRNLS